MRTKTRLIEAVHRIVEEELSELFYKMVYLDNEEKRREHAIEFVNALAVKIQEKVQHNALQRKTSIT